LKAPFLLTAYHLPWMARFLPFICSDLGMGYLLDHTESRIGKARPWIIGMAIPLGLIAPALFMIPSGLTSIKAKMKKQKVIRTYQQRNPALRYW
jgi:hypothetical protein